MVATDWSFVNLDNIFYRYGILTHFLSIIKKRLSSVICHILNLVAQYGCTKRNIYKAKLFLGRKVTVFLVNRLDILTYFFVMMDGQGLKNKDGTTKTECGIHVGGSQ